jgi:hypothetical protein
MLQRVLLMIFLAIVIIAAPGCNHNKIACPTYADSFPEKKAHKQTKPKAEKISKPRLSIFPK